MRISDKTTFIIALVWIAIGIINIAMGISTIDYILIWGTLVLVILLQSIRPKKREG